MRMKGTTAITKLKKPSKLEAQGTPNLRYIGSAANGRTQAKRLRLKAEEAIAEAAKIS